MLDEMEPAEKALMFYSWLEDYEEKNEMIKNHGYLVGSFINPEAVKKMLDSTNISVSDEEFDATSEEIRRVNEEAMKESNRANGRKRRRKKVIDG